MVKATSTLLKGRIGLSFLNLVNSLTRQSKNTNQKKGFILLIMLFLLFSITLNAQVKQVSGTVKDADNLPLPGVNVMIKNTSKGTVTDLNGNFSIDVEPGTVLVFSSVGLLKEEITVGNESNIDVTMALDITSLAEVVVIGYGSVKKSDMTGAIGVVSTDDFKLQHNIRVENLLQGKVAGVTVTQNSGAPGSAAKVRVRGYSTGGDPLYVIDGLIGADINAINPDDIASLSILKDASASAIYGANGAHGVIIITTKSGGKDEKIKVFTEYNHSLSVLSRKMDLLDPVAYMKAVNKKNTEDGGGELFSRDSIATVQSLGYGTDWQDEIFQPAHADNLQLAVAGGNEKSTFRLSLGGRNEDGILINTNYKRYNVRLNTRTDITESTKLVFNVQNSFEQLLNTNANRDKPENDIVQAALAWSPNLPVYNDQTDDYMYLEGKYGSTVRRNPVYLANEINNERNNNIFSGNLSLTQKILSDLSLKLFGAVQVNNGMGNTFERYAPYNKVKATESYAKYVASRRTNLQGSSQIDYNKTFNDNSSLVVVAVVESRYSRGTNFSFRANNPYTDILEYYSVNAVDASSLSGGEAEYKPAGMLSYLGRVSYSFRNKILLTGSLRRDISSRLPEGKRGDNFPSAAIAYRISEESFLKNNASIQDLKLRISYGETGDVRSIDPFQVQDLIKSTSRYWLDGENPALSFGFEDGGDRANPLLEWEKAKQLNGGIDLILWNGMVSFAGDYYVKNTYDLHTQKQIPQYLGGGSQVTNDGTIKNSGVELQSTIKWLQKKRSADWEFTTTLNFSYNKSKMVNQPKDTIYKGSKENGFAYQSHVAITGEPLGSMVGYEYIGVDENGDAQYRDVVKDGFLNSEDLLILGNGNPDYTWGLNANLGYKNLSLNVFIRGVHGMQVYNLTKHMLYGGGAGVVNGTSAELTNSYSFNPNGSLPSLSSDFRAQSSLFVEDAGFVKVSNISLAYDVPQSAIKKFDIQAYISVSNVFTFTNYTGYDPETTSGGDLNPGIDRGSFPISRTFIIGLKVNI